VIVRPETSSRTNADSFKPFPPADMYPEMDRVAKRDWASRTVNASNV
jgi:hypothetical protein